MVISAMFIAGLNLNAETVSQKMASQLASTFFNTVYGEVTAKPKLVWNGRELTTDRLFAPFYVYNHPRGGFVVISAENKAFPVLAYSKNSIFDKSRMDQGEKDLFTRYAREIEMIRYDSRSPESAIEAWGNLAQYVTDVLNNPYATPEYRRLGEEAKESLEQIDRRNSAIFMPTAVEFNIYDPDRYRDYSLDDVTTDDIMEEEVPFKFYEDFISDIAEEERARAAAYENILHPTEPLLHYLGGGHITIQLPTDARLMRVYSIAGGRMQEKYFHNTPLMNIDLSGMPSGYYVILALAENGDIYSFKVRR